MYHARFFAVSPLSFASIARPTVRAAHVPAWRWRYATAAILRDATGVSAAEFAIAAPILLGLLVPVGDLGIAFSTQLQVEQAVQAGAQYAATHPWNNNSSNDIAAAVTSASGLAGLAASPMPQQVCGCSTGTAITTVTCGGTCPDGDPAGYYAVVSAQYRYTPVLPYSFLGNSLTLTAQSMIRTR